MSNSSPPQPRPPGTPRCRLDENLYPAGIKVADQEIAAINICRSDFHGEWNYSIKPRSLKSKL
ncbi:hypothetical protein BQ8794_70314 [Mesorhizobium prunaredense]|uniref:Transposase n=1 Tax=Mesorhizobium prunaredense TaxID=1631249 RepID=A0A1R3VHR6_9HYPH|nr:hypothetical protein BQ8794_70314 [Mesorhizobium prunaredense]